MEYAIPILNMSQKRKPHHENLAFTVNVTPNKHNKVEDEDYVAVLAPFNPFPRVEFNSIKLNSSSMRYITLKNPNKNAIHVELTKLPESEQGFQWSDTQFELPGETETTLTVAWTPLEYGSSRHNIKIVNVKNKKILSEIVLISSTVDPPKNPRRCLRRHSNTAVKKTSSSYVKKIKTSVSNTFVEDKENIHVDDTKVLTAIEKRHQNSTFVLSSKQPKISHHSSTVTKTTNSKTSQHSSTVTKTTNSEAIKSTVTTTVNVKSEQLAQQLFVEHPIPRRSTYEVYTPSASCRRSTYSLRSQTITNIIDVEREKLKFEAIASPGVLNDSLENAALKLVQEEPLFSPGPCISNKNGGNKERNRPMRRLSEEFDALNFSLNSKASSDLSDCAGNHSPKVFLFDVKSISNKFNLDLTKTLNLNQLVSCTQISSQDDESDKDYQEEFLSNKTAHNISGDPQYEIFEKSPACTASTKFKMKPFSESISHVPLDLDKFDLSTVMTSSRNNSVLADSLEHQFNDFSSLGCQSIESQEININDTFTKTRGSNNPNQNEFEVDDSYSKLSDFETKAKVEQTSKSSSQSEIYSDSLEKEISETFLIKQEPQDVVDQVSAAGTTNSTLNLFVDPSKEITQTKQKPIIFPPEKEQKKVVINNFDHGSQIEGVLSTINITESKSSLFKMITHNLSPTKIKIGINEIKHENESNSHSGSLEKEISETFIIKQEPQDVVNQVLAYGTNSILSLPKDPSHEITQTKEKPVIWDISPPKKEQKTAGSKYLVNIPQIKKVPSTRNITRAKSSLCQITTNNILPTKTKVGGRDIQPRNENDDCENVFLVPTVNTKRSSSTLLKTFNSSPPKVRKISQEFKVKRLATPTYKKTTMTSVTDKKKKTSVAVPSSLPRHSSLLKKRKSVKVTDWLPIRKLKLSTGQSQEDLTVEPPVNFSSPDSFLAATSLNPFCKGSVYYNEKWLEDQEQELIAWTARMLQPPIELQLDRDQSKRGPLYRLDALRATAFSLLVSAETIAALAKVKVAVEKKIIAIRDDKQLHVDLGLQDKIIRLLMCYNPLWLRLCLEAIYQCNIHLKCHSDQAGLKNFIRARVVSDEFIKTKYSHPTIPYLWLPEFEEKMKKFTLYKFLVLVYLLDLVKNKKVMLHDPCLFNKDSKFKASKEILIEFNKDFISGSGDLTKTLRLKGYNVTHSQTYLNEFDFTLTNRSELRDGVRLTKLAEILTGDNTLCSKLRVPAIDNFQKEHNAKIALSALRNTGHSLPQDVLPKDISDGHKEKTLSLLWHLRGIIQKRSVQLIILKWQSTKELRRDRKHFLKIRRCVVKIQKWYRRMKQAKEMSNEDLRRGKEDREYFLKLKSAALLVQRKFRTKREAHELAKRSVAASVIQKWYKSQTVMIKERGKFKLLKSAVITVQRAYKRHKWHKLSFELVERKLFLKQKNAAITIQQKFKAYQLRKYNQLIFIQIKTATITIQRRFRAYYQTKTVRKTFLEIKTAAIVIQKRFRSIQLAKKERESFLRHKAATLILQKSFRARRLRKQQQQSFNNLKATVLMVQRRFRAKQIAKNFYQNFLKIKAATLTLQRKYRANVFAKEVRKTFLHLKAVVIFLQRKFRAKCLGRKEKNAYLKIKNTTVFLQQKFRANYKANKEKLKFSQLKSATVLIQRKFKANLLAKLQRDSYLNLRSKTIFVQRRIRANSLAKHQRKFYLKLMSTVISVQRRFKANRLAKLEHTSYMKLKSSAVCIQRKFRANRLAKHEQESYKKLKSTAIYIQRKFRANRLANLEQGSYLKLKSSAICIQRKFRANHLAKLEQESYKKLKSSVILIQRKFRANCLAKHEQDCYMKLKSSAICIQRKFRANRLAKLEQDSYKKLKSSVIFIQRKFRANCLAKTEQGSYQKLKSSAICIQRKFRATRLANLEKGSYLKLKSSAICFQRKFRANRLSKQEQESYKKLKSTAIYIQRKFRANRLANLEQGSYLKLKSSAICIQRKFRANHLAKLEQESYKKLKSSVILIQRKFRANCLAKHEQDCYMKLKSSAICIQRKFRANRFSKLEQESYKKLRSLVILIQRKFRANCLAKHEQDCYMKLKSSAICIQRKFRANRLAKLEQASYNKLMSSVIFIQRKFRANCLAKTEQGSYQKLKSSAICIQRKFRATRLANLEQGSYLKLKSSAICIQRKFRANRLAKLEQGYYKKLQTTIICIQRKFRANSLAKLEQDSYQKLKSSAIVIQRKFRANRLAKLEQQSYMNLKTTAIYIQRKFRANRLANLEQESYKKLMSSAICIQRKFRANRLAKLELGSYMKLKSSAICIQRKFRANRLGNLEQESYKKLKSSVILIQRKFRANRLAKVEQESYTKLKASAICIQRKFRSNCIAKLEQRSCIKLKTTAIYIQRKFRANRLAKLEQGYYMKLKSSVIWIQRKFRANQEAKAIHQSFLKKKSAAILIQQKFRAKIFRTKAINHLHEMKCAAISLQRRFRAKSLARKDREYYKNLLSATIFVQRRFRLLRETKMYRLSFLKLKSTVLLVQKHFRAKCLSRKERQHYLKLKSLVLLVQRRYRLKILARRREVVCLAGPTLEEKSIAATKIQAAWRGKMVRRKVVVPRPKVKPSDADPFRHTISTRGQHLLSMLHSFTNMDIALLIKALANLDRITVLSSDQCEHFANNGAVGILFDILKGSYKAFGIDQAVELSLLVILNMYRSPKTAEIVWKETVATNGINRLFDLMLKFRSEKTSSVFCIAATVVWIFAKDPKKTEVIKNTSTVLPTIKYIAKNFEKPAPSKTKKVKAAETTKKFPAIKPNWGNYFNDPRAFNDKSFALDSLMDVLHLKT